VTNGSDGGKGSEGAVAGAPSVYAEPGARWRTVAYGPLLCLVVLIIELASGSRTHWVTLLIFAVILAAVVGVQVAAARTHISVELTPTTLRNGTETLALNQIAAVLPPRGPTDYAELPWDRARVLGELADVPRKRRPIGLRLRAPDSDEVLVRAWARDDAALRAALVATLERMEGDNR
jgi:hypothetical protein